MAKVLKLRKKEIPYEEIQVPVEQLAFYPENPRIYSQFAGSGDRTQENIQSKLEGMDHVKELRSQIDKDGQVNEPLFCIPVLPESELHGLFKYQVLEGNSRLAALRMNKKGSLPPPRLTCNVLDFSAYSEQETESLIFSLLGQFHIIGKTDWRSYENAAYIYRRFKNHQIQVEDIAREIALSPTKVRQMVNAFQMMIDAGDDNTSRWSYYEAYASSTKLRNHRENIPGLHDRVVELIKEDKFPRALDMRDKLPDILRNQRARKIFLDQNEPEPFKEALAVADISGDTDAAFKRLQRFRIDLAATQTRGQITKLLRSDSSKGRTEYELNQIVKFANQLLNRAAK
ncbi:MAG: hypothetical protein OXC99_02995 [Chloroflexi bacterium]|nr:hypothetical protein [Chloroflexota bacterium]